ncbi:MAG: PEGA domain protein [Deltaproteobacteria bacterium ADurb.Bin058]|nr:MAG: PEGA domain protein [Deltaproteobacteria bacterium ADurb.Bin058]
MRKHLPQLCLWFVTCLAGVLPAASAVAQPAEIIAVFDIETRNVRLKAATLVNLNDYMYGRLAVAGFKLTPQSQVRERVVEPKAASHMDCYDQSCQIELGKTVAAQKSLASRLIKIGDSCSLQSQIYDLRTETIVKGAEAQGPCTETGIAASIDQVVAKLQGRANQSSEITAVFDIESKSIPIETGVMVDLGDYMFVRLAAAGFQLIHQSQVRERVIELKREFHKDCYDASCQIKLGQYVAAYKSLSSRLVKIGDSCSLQAVIYDLKTETAERGAEAQGPCTVSGIMASIDRVIAIFTGKVTATDSSRGGAGSSNVPTYESGVLVIRSNPSGATISVNGQKVGQTPQQLVYPVGRYIVVAELGNLYYPTRQEVSLTKKGAQVNLNLKPAFGSAKITSLPSKARVLLDGEYVGETPLVIPQKLSGTYKLRLELSDYLSSEAVLVIKDGKETLHHVELMANWGKLHVTSEPAGAMIYIDGALVKDKTTPCTLDQIKPGSHVVKFSLAGHHEHSERTNVVHGQVASVSANLQPIRGRLAVTSSYSDGVACEGDLRIDGNLISQTPWEGDVSVAPHTVEVQCTNGKASQGVVVAHNTRSEVNVLIDALSESVGDVPQSVGIIAVFNIEKSKSIPLKADVMADLNDYMYGRLASVGFTLIPKDRVQEGLVALKRKTHMDCYDKSCQIDLARSIAANKSLSSKLIKLGDVCSLQSQVYDLLTETTEKGVEAQGPCTIAGIKASIDQVITKLKKAWTIR